MTYKKIIRPLLFKIEPEQVHHLLVNGLKCYRHLSPIRSGIRKKYHTYKPFTYKNIVFPNRIGLAAGFDKDAAVFDELADFGFRFITTSPTMDRSNLSNAAKTEADNIGAGGVSGKGIGAKSVNVVRYFKSKTQGEFLFIGAGGIMTKQDAKSMLQAGAELLQVYSTLIYNGPNAILDLNKSI